MPFGVNQPYNFVISNSLQNAFTDVSVFLSSLISWFSSFSHLVSTTLVSLLFLDSPKHVSTLRPFFCSSSGWNVLIDLDPFYPLTSLRSPLRNQFIRENLPPFPDKCMSSWSFFIPLLWYTFLMRAHYFLKVYIHLLTWLLSLSY